VKFAIPSLGRFVYIVSATVYVKVSPRKWGSGIGLSVLTCNDSSSSVVDINLPTLAALFFLGFLLIGRKLVSA